MCLDPVILDRSPVEVPVERVVAWARGGGRCFEVIRKIGDHRAYQMRARMDAYLVVARLGCKALEFEVMKSSRDAVESHQDGSAEKDDINRVAALLPFQTHQHVLMEAC